MAKSPWPKAADQYPFSGNSYIKSTLKELKDTKRCINGARVEDKGVGVVLDTGYSGWGSGRARYLLNKHPVPWPRLEKTGGPTDAVQEFLKTNKSFEVTAIAKNLVAQDPSGVLKQIS
jgi:hypothetical protein